MIMIATVNGHSRINEAWISRAWMVKLQNIIRQGLISSSTITVLQYHCDELP